MGSWRYNNTKDEKVFATWIAAIKNAGIKSIAGRVVALGDEWENQLVPGGWIWEDMGNYFGAGVSALNWHENQYDILLRSGRPGDKVTVIATKPFLYNVQLQNQLVSGQAGSGDNAYIFLPPYGCTGTIRGTIPPAKNTFTISGSLPNPPAELGNLFTAELLKNGITVQPFDFSFGQPGDLTQISTHISPPLDSITYWFLKKSINLYGEALLKTIAFNQKHDGSTEAGLAAIKTFWKEKGIKPTAINMVDGSGLSPANRITPAALVHVMKYAKQQPWFAAFYNALPEYNAIKMKSGTIGGTKSFTGYINNYAFSIVVSNFNGPVSEVVQKMYKILNILK